MIYATVFLLAIVIDALYVIWARAATSRRSVLAGLSSGFLQVASVLSVILYVAEPSLIVPNVLGHGLGSYLAVKYGGKSETPRQSG